MGGNRPPSSINPLSQSVTRPTNTPLGGASFSANQNAGRSAAVLAAGLGDIGQALTGVVKENSRQNFEVQAELAKRDLQQAQELSTSRIAQTVATSNAEQDKFTQDYQLNYNGEPETYMTGLQDGLKKIREQHRGLLATDRERIQFDTHTIQNNANSEIIGEKAAWQYRSAKSTENTQTSINTVQQSVSTNQLLPTMDLADIQRDYTDKKTQIFSLIDSSFTTPQAKMVAKTKAAEELSNLYLQSVALKNPYKLEEMVNNGVALDASAEKIPAWQYHAESTIQQAQKAADVALEKKLKAQAEGEYLSFTAGTSELLNAGLNGDTQTTDNAKVQINSLLGSEHITLEQKMNLVKVAQQIQATSALSPVAANIKNGTYTIYDGDAFIASQDPSLHKDKYTQPGSYDAAQKGFALLKEQWEATKNSNVLGIGSDGKPLSGDQLIAMGASLKASAPEISTLQNQMREAYKSNGIDGLAKFGDQVMTQYGSIRFDSVMNQIIADPTNQVANKDSIYAMKIQDPMVRKLALQAATSSVDELTKNYALANNLKPAEALKSFENQLTNSPNVKAFFANPALTNSSLAERQQLTSAMAKTALLYMQSGTPQAQAIESVTQAMLPGKAHGNTILSAKNYDEQVRKVNLMLQNIDNPSDAGNLIRQQLTNVKYGGAVSSVSQRLLSQFEQKPSEWTGVADVPIKVTSPYGRRTAPKAGASTDHKGVDIGWAAGTALYTPQAGNVTYAGWKKGFGNVVEVKLDSGKSIVYAHMASNSVQSGSRVDGHTLVGKVGSTGNSTGPHAHIEALDENGKHIDPMSLLSNSRPSTDPYDQYRSAAKLQTIRQNGGSLLIDNPQLSLMQDGVSYALGTAKGMAFYKSNKDFFSTVSRQPLGSQSTLAVMESYKSRVQDEINKLPAARQKEAQKRFDTYYTEAKKSSNIDPKFPSALEKAQRQYDLKYIKQYGKLWTDPTSGGKASFLVIQDTKGMPQVVLGNDGRPVRVWNHELDKYTPSQDLQKIQNRGDAAQMRTNFNKAKQTDPILNILDSLGDLGGG